jgi:hypothetical protein
MSTTESELASVNRVDVSLQRSSSVRTDDQALWAAIRNRTEAVSFNRYEKFIDCLIRDAACDKPGTAAQPISHPVVEQGESSLDQLRLSARRMNLYGMDGYQFLKIATRAFLLIESGVAIVPEEGRSRGDVATGETTRIGEPLTYEQLQANLEDYLKREIGGINDAALPYLKRIVNALIGSNASGRTDHYEAVLKYRVTHPSLIELIHTYWLEQGFLMQAINAIALRFQNRRLNGHDPLAALEIAPLYPLTNVMWGFIQDEIHRLSVSRRAYEYDHQYGLQLIGRAISEFNPADSRRKFIEAFHTLLGRAADFFREDADTTIISDGFRLLNALKEVHLLLAEGAHNQFGELPSQARAETLIVQWMLARPEMREFLGGRAMVPYPERWMAQVDTMKRMYGAPATSINHFRDLATFGEQIVLSIRYGDWINVNDQEQARNWARYFKPELQSYMHSYQAVTGVDLAAPMTDMQPASDRLMQPAELLRHQLTAQKTRTVRPQLANTAGQRVASPFMRQRLLSRMRDE